MRIIVTGGAGFIGSNTVDLFIQEGHNVAVVDNLFTGKQENVHPRAAFYVVDITNRKSLELVFDNFKPEAVIHMAAQTDVRWQPHISIEEGIAKTVAYLRQVAVQGEGVANVA